MKEFSSSEKKKQALQVKECKETLKKTSRILNNATDIMQNQQYKFGESIDKEEAEHQKII